MEFNVHFQAGRQGKRKLAAGPAPESTPDRAGPPRVTRLLALAHRWNDLLEHDEVENQAEIARLMGITEARVSQIMSLVFLAPSIQEQLLLGVGPRTSHPLAERHLRKACAAAAWATHTLRDFRP
jgi:hypothetical protein